MGLIKEKEFFIQPDEVFEFSHNGSNNLRVGSQFASFAVRDYEDLSSRIELDCSDDAKKNLCIQSIEGHAKNGHCKFDGNAFLAATIEDVLEALFIDVAGFKEQRQEEVDRAFRW